MMKAQSGGGSGDPGGGKDPGGHHDLLPDWSSNVAEEEDDDYISGQIVLRYHCIARCVSKLSTSPLEEGCMHTSRTILQYDSMCHTPFLLRRVVHIS